MQDNAKFQWSKFSDDRSEQFVIRTENWQELVDYRIRTNVLIEPKKVEQQVIPTKAPIQPVAPVVTDDGAHVCPVHNTPMTFKSGVGKSTGKPYKVWSCTQKENGQWCDQKEWVK